MRRKLNPEAHSLIAKTGLSLSDFAAQANIDRSILYRIGRTVRGSTAWKIARTLAAASGTTPEQAYAQIIVEESADRAE